MSKRIIKKSKTLKIVQRIKPCLKAFLPSEILFEASASATRGVIAVENPIPKDIAIKTKLLPSETAASSAVPS